MPHSDYHIEQALALVGACGAREKLLEPHTMSRQPSPQLNHRPRNRGYGTAAAVPCCPASGRGGVRGHSHGRDRTRVLVCPERTKGLAHLDHQDPSAEQTKRKVQATADVHQPKSVREY